MDHSELIGIVSERPRNYAWLLGAGASRSAGLPTATDILWDLKRRYYCREENQEITQQDIQNDAVRSKIQSYMLSKGFPRLWAENEYPEYFEKIFGDNYERQNAYLNAILSENRVSLSVGNRALGALIGAGHARAIFTTNFDSVIEKAVAEVCGSSLSSFHVDGAYAANDALNNERYPIYVKLHGDFRYRSIKNLPGDLASQNEELGKCFVNACNRFGLIVSGYSGRDASVMELLKSILATSNPFPHGLFWTGLAGSHVPAPVKDLFEACKKRGVKTEYVNIETFDAFLLRLWRNTQDKPPNFDAKVRKTQNTKVSIPMLSTRKTGKPIRMNAVPLTLPTHCLTLNLREHLDWNALKNKERESLDEIILTKSDSVLMWGNKKVAETLFDGKLVDISPFDLSPRSNDLINNLYLKPFIEKALGFALARNKPLISRYSHNRTYLVAARYGKEENKLEAIAKAVEKVHGEILGLFTKVTEEHPIPEQVTWSQALQISIEQKNGDFWLLLEPNIWVWPSRARRDAVDMLDKLKEKWFNEKADLLLSAWSQVIFGNDERDNLEVRPYAIGDDSENPKFILGRHTAFSWEMRS